MPPIGRSDGSRARRAEGAGGAAPSWFAIGLVLSALVGAGLWLAGAFRSAPAAVGPTRPAVSIDPTLASWRAPMPGGDIGHVEWLSGSAAGDSIRIAIDVEGDLQSTIEFAAGSREASDRRWRVARSDWPRGFTFELSIIRADGQVLRRSGRQQAMWPD